MKCAIDPGVRKKQGIAIFDEKNQLVLAMAASADSIPGLIKIYDLKLAVVEMPVHRREFKGNQNDILDLAVSVGRLGGMFPEFQLVKPEEWKNGYPKNVVIERVKSRLTADEMVCVSDQKLSDVWEAIGIGFFAFDSTRSLMRRCLNL